MDMLDVGQYDLDYLPQEMGRVKKLYNLNVNNNRLLTLPDTIRNRVVSTSPYLGIFAITNIVLYNFGAIWLCVQLMCN
jgi:hypothetical protein